MTDIPSDDYRALVDQSATLIWRTDIDGQCDYFNSAWLDFTGLPLEQQAGEGWMQAIHPDDVQVFLSTYRDGLSRREGFDAEFRLRRADGHYRRILLQTTTYADTSGTFLGFIGSCVDIDGRRVREVSTAADDFFEMSLDNVCVAGFDGYFKRLNASWIRTLGWTHEELLSRPIVDFVHPDDREQIFTDRKRLKSGDDVGRIINRYRCKDGSYRWLEWRSVAHQDRQFVYAVARDITERKLANERLRESEEQQDSMRRQLIFSDRMASVGTLAAGVAHEINNPLAYVSANISLMLEELTNLATGPSAAHVETLAEIATEAKEGADRIRKIVRGLKTFSRAEEEHLTVMSLEPLLEMSIDMTRNEIRHRARLVLDFGEVPHIKGDEARLGQVFVNLLVNAAQALADGDSEANEIRVVTTTDSAGRAVVEISDTGCGIPADVIDRVFDPFFTTKPIGIGTGLGLSICHNIVTSLGGEISVTSESGLGTTFRIVLPAAEGIVEVKDELSITAGSADCVTVLVVDDEPSIGYLLQRVLKDHDVTAVTTAREALQLLESGKQFQIIFSDLMMPEMSGMDFYGELGGRFPDAVASVVFVTGGAFTPGAHQFLDSVPNELLEKPFTPKAVRDLVQRRARGAQTLGS